MKLRQALYDAYLMAEAARKWENREVAATAATSTEQREIRAATDSAVRSAALMYVIEKNFGDFEDFNSHYDDYNGVVPENAELEKTVKDALFETADAAERTFRLTARHWENCEIPTSVGSSTEQTQIASATAAEYFMIFYGALRDVMLEAGVLDEYLGRKMK